MSSSYYVNALFSKYTAGASLFQNAEPTSCSFATNSQRSGYGPGAGAFASSVPGVYNVNSAIYPGPFSSGYGLGSDAYNLHCSSFDQNIPVLCNDLTKGSCEKAEASALHSQAETNFRIYPWMRSSGRASGHEARRGHRRRGGRERGENWTGQGRRQERRAEERRGGHERRKEKSGQKKREQGRAEKKGEDCIGQRRQGRRRGGKDGAGEGRGQIREKQGRRESRAGQEWSAEARQAGRQTRSQSGSCQSQAPWF